MKCINCGTDNNLKDRTANNGKCRRCGHTFVFEPTSMLNRARFTDLFFAKILRNISANNTLYFTPKQFFYLLEKRSGSKQKNNQYIACGCIPIAFGFFLFAVGTDIGILFLGILFLLIGITFFSIVYLISRKKRPRQSLAATPRTVKVWLQRWSQVNSVPEKLLPEPGERSDRRSIQSDVSAYSFDRVIVCDNNAIAQMLIANNFHFEHNCAILSITGYPQSIFETTMEMLRRNPDLQVFALHDCTPKGLELARKLRTDPDWFRGSNIAIADVGLSPKQILAAKRDIFVRVSEECARGARNLSAEIRYGLSAEELKWLEAGNFVELESFGPGQLIRILELGIFRSQKPELAASSGDVDFSASDDGSSERFIYIPSSFG